MRAELTPTAWAYERRTQLAWVCVGRGKARHIRDSVFNYIVETRCGRTKNVAPADEPVAESDICAQCASLAKAFGQ